MATQHETARHRISGARAHDCRALIAKLTSPSALSSDDEQALRAICEDLRVVEAKRDIIKEGDSPRHVQVILEGWAARYKLVAGGARQISAILLPGDFCDLHVTILRKMDHSIMALSRVTLAQVPYQTMENLLLQRPELGRVLWWSTFVDEAILRSWIVNLGRRGALERIAHFFCEIHARLKLVGMVEDNRFSMPMTQEVLGDALGLTAVHVNRMLQRLKSQHLVELSRGELTILDIAGLQRLAGFDPTYLHQGRLVPLKQSSN